MTGSGWDGVAFRNEVKSSTLTSGKSWLRADDSETSMIPRRMSRDARALSANAGMSSVDGIGSGGGERWPKRTLIA
jgi:hypothetical protein